MSPAEHNDGESDRLTEARASMLALLRRHIRSERVIAAMAGIPRERFVPERARDQAYADCPLPIAAGQTISQPMMVALTVESAEVQPNDRVLEVGTDSGYQAAVLSRLATDVTTVERIPELRASAENLLRDVGYANVHVYDATSFLGHADSAPYDAIVVAAGAPHVPRPLLDQLAPGGRLVVPVGDRLSQQLIRARRTAHGVTIEWLGPCAFVPLVGAGAWADAGDGEASRRLKV